MVSDLSPRHHHIRAVADLFLDPPAAVVAAAPFRAVADTHAYRFAVAAAGHGFLAAWTAAGLARASLALGGPGARTGRMRVTLEEWHRQPWAAEPFLGGGDRERLRALFRPLAFGHAECDARRWLSGVEVVQPRFRGESPGDEPGAVCAWINLGGLGERSLAALEAARAWDGGTPFGEHLDGLVWCVCADEASGLRTAYSLGRLVAALRPRQLKLLVFSAGPAAEPQPVEVQKRREALARLAAPAAAVELLAEIPDPRRALAAESSLPFARLAASLALGAAAMRSVGAVAREVCA